MTPQVPPSGISGQMAFRPVTAVGAQEQEAKGTVLKWAGAGEAGSSALEKVKELPSGSFYFLKREA